MAEVHRILLFGSQITTGGAQRVLLDQADWFQSRGFAVSAVFYYDKDGLLPDWRRRYPFPITVLSVYRKGEGDQEFSGASGGDRPFPPSSS